MMSIVLYGGGAASDDAKKALVETTLVGDKEFPTGCPAVGWRHRYSARRTAACERAVRRLCSPRLRRRWAAHRLWPPPVLSAVWLCLFLLALSAGHCRAAGSGSLS